MTMTVTMMVNMMQVQSQVQWGGTVDEKRGKVRGNVER